ncbi:MAG: nickel-dependent lactate racemase [Pyrinomonadaceae bacterium]
MPPERNIVHLKYGRDSIELGFDPDRFEILRSAGGDRPPVSDVRLGEMLDRPVDSPPLEEIVGRGESVLLVVPDATRQTAAGQVVNLVVRRLIANGTQPHEIAIIFATGIHRRVTEAERAEILTPFIAQRIKTFDHAASMAITNFRFGETSGGIPVELDWRLSEFDHVVPVGGAAFHYFAGFTGGRKLICPGLASERTIAETHKLAFDCRQMRRSDGVGPALLDGNPVHEAFVEAAAFAEPSFCITTIVDEAGRATDLFCGDWITSHRAACDEFAARHTVEIEEGRDLVIASCGGWPHDINLIQAHKTLEAASRACRDGGTIVLLAKCEDGLGRADFIDWFDAGDSQRLAVWLCENYQVNGQTAWSLMRKAEKFDVRIVTSLPPEVASRTKMTPYPDLDSALAGVKTRTAGFILPFGAKTHVVAAT